MKKPSKATKRAIPSKPVSKPVLKKPSPTAMKGLDKPAARKASPPPPARKATPAAKAHKASPPAVPKRTAFKKPFLISVKKHAPASVKTTAETIGNSAKKGTSSAAPQHAEKNAVATALKGKLLELQQRSALKRSRTAAAFSFEDASDILGTRRGQLKVFRTQESDQAKKSLKKEDLLPTIKQRSVGAASLDDILGLSLLPSVSRVKKDPDMERVPQKFRRHYKLLLDMRKRVSEGLNDRAKDTLKRSTKEDSGDLAAYGPDSGTDTFDRDFALNLVSSEQDLLFEINQAIHRLGNDTYGICEITGKPIPLDRLTAVPFTRYSLEGQKELESTSKRKTYIEPATNLTETGEEDSRSAFSDDDSDE